MLTHLALALVFAGGVAAQSSISEQDQIYVVSGVLGGVCLLLTIVAIFTTLAIVKLRTQVAVLQAGAQAMAANRPSDGGAYGSHSDLPAGAKPQPYQVQQQPSKGLLRSDPPPMPRNEGSNRPVPPPRPYRAPRDSREYY